MVLSNRARRRNWLTNRRIAPIRMLTGGEARDEPQRWEHHMRANILAIGLLLLPGVAAARDLPTGGLTLE